MARNAVRRTWRGEGLGAAAPLWASLLVVYEPMLARLRSRLISNALPSGELDQTVLCSFLQAIDELTARDVQNLVPVRPRQRTQRHVFSVLRKERQEQHSDMDVETLAATDAESQAPGPAEPARDQDVDSLQDTDLKDLLRHGWEVGLTQGGKDVVDATVIGREPLREYVNRMLPDDAAAQERLYQRLKRSRTRALQRLRSFAECPRPSSPFVFSNHGPANSEKGRPRREEGPVTRRLGR